MCLMSAVLLKNLGLTLAVAERICSAVQARKRRWPHERAFPLERSRFERFSGCKSRPQPSVQTRDHFRIRGRSRAPTEPGEAQIC